MSKANNLSIEDIHNIRYENYEATKGLSFSELIRQTSQKAQAFKMGFAKCSLQEAGVAKVHAFAEPEMPIRITPNPARYA